MNFTKIAQLQKQQDELRNRFEAAKRNIDYMPTLDMSKIMAAQESSRWIMGKFPTTALFQKAS